MQENSVCWPRERDARPLCVMLSSCVSMGPRYFLPLSEYFIKRYQFPIFGCNLQTGASKELAEFEELIHGAEFFIHHSVEWMACIGADLDAYEQMLLRVPARVKKIAFPLPQMLALWPFHCGDPRNEDVFRPRNWHGAVPTYPYGDSHLLDLMKQGIPSDEVIDRYLKADISSVVDLDRIMSSTMIWLERGDRDSDVKVCDYIASNIQSKRLFQSVNHASNRLLLYMTNQVLRLLDCPPLSDGVLDRTFEILDPQMPIHPGIARHFGLTYADETTRYRIDPLRNLTFAEYIRDYVYFA